jgi:NAD(P)-dependent dehydrogenase (short-subunit alcohol dehydrogenase family)
MSKRLEGKIALVTGASSGLGKATALAFAREGATVVVSARRAEEVENTAHLIREEGGHALAVVTDVTSSTQVETMISTVISTYGKIDVAFNNAGVFDPEGLVHEINEELWDKLINTNLKGTWLCMKAELPHMLEQGCGSIINMSSTAGLSGWSDNPIYSASKHGVIGLTRSAALQYAPYGIRINAVCPAFTQIEAMDAILAETPEAAERMQSTIPLGRIGQKEEIAEAVLWLASDAASFCVGHALTLDGGQASGLWR